MAETLKIELSPQARKLVANFQTMPERMLIAIAQAMDKENLHTVSYIQQHHLTGQGPFPVAEHRLGVRTSRLRGSVNASPAVIQDQSVDSGIGSNVIYAAIHEFGGRIPHKARQQTIRHRTDASGNLLRQAINPHLLVFAKKSHARVRETKVEIAAHDVVMPERAPFRTGIQACLQNYGKTISRAIIAEATK